MHPRPVYSAVPFSYDRFPDEPFPMPSNEIVPPYDLAYGFGYSTHNPQAGYVPLPPHAHMRQTRGPPPSHPPFTMPMHPPSHPQMNSYRYPAPAHPPRSRPPPNNPPPPQLERAPSHKSKLSSRSTSPNLSKRQKFITDDPVLNSQPSYGAEYAAIFYSRLSASMKCMVDDLTPSAFQRNQKMVVFNHVITAARQVFGREYPRTLDVQAFGSFVNGLGTTGSDIDVVITGVAEPDPGVGFFEKRERVRVASMLDQLVVPLKRLLQVRSLTTIRSARIPLIRLTTNQDVVVDISLGSAAGPQAAQYIASQVSAYPALRPLVLVLKAYLKACNLNDVASGGLSTYGLTYMTLAHILEEGRARRNIHDVGCLLHSFFERYSGHGFDRYSKAVSVKDGGVVDRSAVRARGNNPERFAVIDPLTGRNITEGTYRADEVVHVFESADMLLSQLAAGVSGQSDDDPLHVLMTHEQCYDY